VARVTFTRSQLRPRPHPQGPRRPRTALPPASAGRPLPARQPGRLRAPPQRGRPSARRAALPGLPRRAGAGAVERPRARAVAADHHRPPPCPGRRGWPPGGRAAPAAADLLCQGGRVPAARAIHFHAVIRLDAATACRCPKCLAAPPEPFTASLLDEALRHAVPAVRVPCPSVDGGPERYARWARSSTFTTSPRTTTRRGSWRPSRWPATSPSTRPRPPRASARAWTGASAPTTWTTSTGCRPMWPSASAPPGSWAAAPSWRACGCGPGRTCWGSGPLVDQSRRYSTTFRSCGGPGGLRQAPPGRDGIPLDAWGRPEDDQAVIVVASWCSSARAMRPKGSGGWHCRPPLVPGSTEGWRWRS
jgi:hypothetical protein